MRVSWALSGVGGIEGVLREAGLCERAGLAGVWYCDYQAPFSGTLELFVVLSQLAARTKECFIGSLVTDVLRRRPIVIAHAFATLSYLAPGRVVLGLGARGGLSQAPYGIPLSNLTSRLREGIEVVRELWRADPEAPAEYRGEYYRLGGRALPSSLPVEYRYT